MGSIGERIKYLRESENISQSELARRINTKRATINAWEMGISNPSVMSLHDLAAYFHVSSDYLLGNECSERIAIDKLSSEEKKIVRRLIHYFEGMPK